MKYSENVFEALGGVLDEKDREIMQLNWDIDTLKKKLEEVKRENERLKKDFVQMKELSKVNG